MYSFIEQFTNTHHVSNAFLESVMVVKKSRISYSPHGASNLPLLDFSFKNISQIVVLWLQPECLLPVFLSFLFPRCIKLNLFSPTFYTS